MDAGIPRAANAVVDRLVHHGVIFEFAGESQSAAIAAGSRESARST